MVPFRPLPNRVDKTVKTLSIRARLNSTCPMAIFPVEMLNGSQVTGSAITQTMEWVKPKRMHPYLRILVSMRRGEGHAMSRRSPVRAIHPVALYNGQARQAWRNAVKRGAPSASYLESSSALVESSLDLSYFPDDELQKAHNLILHPLLYQKTKG